MVAVSRRKQRTPEKQNSLPFHLFPVDRFMLFLRPAQQFATVNHCFKKTKKKKTERRRRIKKNQTRIEKNEKREQFCGRSHCTDTEDGHWDFRPLWPSLNFAFPGSASLISQDNQKAGTKAIRSIPSICPNTRRWGQTSAADQVYDIPFLSIWCDRASELKICRRLTQVRIMRIAIMRPILKIDRLAGAFGMLRCQGCT